MLETLVSGVDNKAANGVPAKAVDTDAGTDKLAPVAALKLDSVCNPLCVKTWPTLSVIACVVAGLTTPAATNPL